MSEAAKRKRKSPKRRQTRRQAEDAAYAMLGREFVRLFRDHTKSGTSVHVAALNLAEWLYEHRLTEAEQEIFLEETGVLFACELPPSDPLLTDFPQPKADFGDEELPF